MKRRTNITINDEIYAKALEVMAADHFDDFSGFIEQLVRDEWRRRHGAAPIILRDQPPTADQLAAAEIERARHAAGTGHTPAGAAYSHTGKAKPAKRPRSAKES